LWWTGDLPGLSRRARTAIEQADRVGVCTISCWEVAMLAARRRIELDPDVRTWVSRALAQNRVESLPLDPEVAVAAGMLAAKLSGDPVDRIVYASAVAKEAPLVTKDRALRAYDPDLTLW
jgi:PIN domain nuclease of toxin-antitoxin system